MIIIMIVIIIKFKLITIAMVNPKSLQRTSACNAAAIPRDNGLSLVWGALLEVAYLKWKF